MGWLFGLMVGFLWWTDITGAFCCLAVAVTALYLLSNAIINRITVISLWCCSAVPEECFRQGSSLVRLSAQHSFSAH